VCKDEIRTSLVDMHINRLNGLRSSNYDLPHTEITELEDEEEPQITIKY